MSNSKTKPISNTQNRVENYSDIEKRFLEQLVTQMERAEERRERRREEFNNAKRTGARATAYRFSY